ncbi:MAG: hypothetical protein EA396_09020 [Anaerolineaceae bacterium]|nr:MAG: hypothetical protein EA396_09020 [Anaerolineaceae bacterium]
MDVEQREQLEAATQALLAAFDIYAPPVPVETMLQNPPPGMWNNVDINQLSGTFLVLKDQYSPRMSLARLLGRHVASSEWGAARGLYEIIIGNEDNLRIFARMLVMPRDMIQSLTPATRNAIAISDEFEVPEEDAQTRLDELLG